MSATPWLSTLCLPPSLARSPLGLAGLHRRLVDVDIDVDVETHCVLLPLSPVENLRPIWHRQPAPLPAAFHGRRRAEDREGCFNSPRGSLDESVDVSALLANRSGD
ncbi:hypothetical protein [Lyngbya confervoides]|uniref:Uncharacterized protein n=1 Tax=Lyngbya confervoides BDU141951 TaxID=1574623 RepID=A0ABD4T2S8_9CYAN|nr:hypothetical protein [Lyngbya confervoides]MCM1982959.1 hypothetical protein [Lyngbya confervoides BDU141951]